MKKITTNERLEQITAKLETGVKEVFTSERFTEYLAVMSRFTRYSVNNQLLIMLQRPTAQHVAGYKAWQTKFNRTVRHGEKAIYILAPQPHTIEKEVVLADGTTETKEVRFTTYKPVPVFGDDQTDGQELPSLCKKLAATVDGYAELKGRLESISPVPVSYEPTNGCNGYFHLTDKRIVVNDSLSQSHTIKTLVHEISHSLLHDKDNGTEADADRKTKEVQAEATAYTVLQWLGIDSSDYSFDYIVSWSSGKDTKELTESLEVIRNTAKMIIEGLEAA